VKVRTVASGVAIAALAGFAVPTALSASASATATPAPPAVTTVTKCSPATATIGKIVTIHGVALQGATSVTIGKKNAAIVDGKDRAKTIQVTVPNLTKAGVYPVKVVTPQGTATNTKPCTFQKAKKKS
jgi:hypothetical protein